MVATPKVQGDAPGWLRASSGNAKARRNLTRVLLLTAALPALVAFPASAAKWDFVPTLSVVETYTDNVSLAPDALKRSDWVTQVVPGIRITADGPGLKFRANYNPEITYYAQDFADQNGVFQNGNAILNAELSNKLLFVDAGADVRQDNISLQGRLTNNNVNTTGNRATVKTFYVSPYVLHDFGSEVQAEVRYKYSVTDSDRLNTSTGSSQDSTENNIDLRLASGPAYKLLTWKLAYDRGTIGYKSPLQGDLDTERISAEARRLITPTVGLRAIAGYEYYKKGDLRPESSGVGWGVGVDWAPSPRTSLTALVGRRFFGNAYNFDFRHRTRLLTLSAGYDQDPTTTSQQFFVPATTSTAGYLDQLYLSKFPDPAARQQAVNSVISQLGIPANLNAPVNYYTEQLFLQKTWRASVAMQGVKNIIIANFFMSDRKALLGNSTLSGVLNQDNNTEQTGTSLSWNLRITSRDAWNLLAGYTRNKFPGSGRVDDLTTLRMGFTRQFQPRLSGSLSYGRQQRDSTSASNYTENAVVGTLQMSF